ncbi:MAG: succinylglutamate desuccinylase/aspartoacylase family protein [Acidobacteriota bacterium]|nr:succinylglutamate desuccinylase/aspartoacylase family protein [Acidobacteriota bacterium]
MSTSLQQPAADLQPARAQDFREPRIVGDCGSAADGPTLLVVAGLHGNEPAGVRGLERIFDRLRADGCMPRGRLVGLAGNRAALEIGQRFIDQDLNRVWVAERLADLRGGGERMTTEDREMAELDAIFARVLAEARGLPFLLDVHTTSGPGPAFSVLHDTLLNRRFGRALPIPIVLGLEEELNGTLTDYFTELGAVALSVEAGQHDDPRSVDRAEAALWIAMDVAGLLPEPYAPELESARALLEVEGRGLPEAVEIRYRHDISRTPGFRMMPGFRSFQAVADGQPIATDGTGTVASPQPGLLIMPLYQRLGDDGFFLARPVRPMWLDLSTVLRRLQLERWLTRLPGIRAVPGRPGTYVVNRHIALWGPRRLFHLLGYRRRDHSPSHLVMERRPEPAVHGSEEASGGAR